MMRKPIKIDWEELESAFQTRREELVYYLDLVTGEVVLEDETPSDGPHAWMMVKSAQKLGASRRRFLAEEDVSP